MKKITLLIIVWFLFLGAGRQTEWWVELITDQETGTITKIARDDYLECKELIEDFNITYTPIDTINQMAAFNEKYERDLAEYKQWEYVEKYEDCR
jgi:hypothetical protein